MSTLATLIRNAAFDRLKRIVVGGVTLKSARKTPFPTLQADQVPTLGVFLLREEMAPDGDANVGPPRYLVDATIGISVIDLDSKPTTLEGGIDDALDAIEDTLLCDPTFLGLRDGQGNGIIEAVPRIQRVYSFLRDGETYYLEGRLQLTVQFRCYFEPLAPNPLTEVDVQAEPFGADASTYQAKITLPQS